MMKCPQCKTASMTTAALPDGPAAHSCVTCNGVWIPGKAYGEWLLSNPGETDPELESDTPLHLMECRAPKTCPDCGTLMPPYKVGHGVNFSIEQCKQCKGLWLDNNEWEALARRNLHHDIHRVYSEEWQSEIRANARREHMDNFYASQWGEQEYEKIQAYHQWLHSHPNKRAILAYLNDPEPLAP